MPDTVEIGLGRSVRRGYRLDEVALVPTRRTRGTSKVSMSWQIDAHSFRLPFVAAPSDAVVSPATAAEIERCGGLAVLDGEGLWTRYEDPTAALAAVADPATDVSEVQRIYAAPVSADLLRRRVKELRDADLRVAVRLSPQHAVELGPIAVGAGVDVLVVQGTVISAEHVVNERHGETPPEALNLKEFVADLDIPVLVGGCSNYQTALHLMRSGAAGVIIGFGDHSGALTPTVLGIDVPMATALGDAAAARRDYLDETGGRYVHLIAYGDLSTGGDIAKAIACGADAVMLGEALAHAEESPGGGAYWDATAGHPRVPRSRVVPPRDGVRPSLERLLRGPSEDAEGTCNLFGSARRAMAKCGYSSVKEFQRAELTLVSPRS